MWKIFLTITFLANGQPAPVDNANKPNPWKVAHHTNWDSEEACKATLEDEAVTQKAMVLFLVANQFKLWNPDADDTKVEFTCEQKAD